MDLFRLRPEIFGYTVYQPTRLEYFFINHKQLQAITKFLPTSEVEKLKDLTSTADISDDISNGKFVALEGALLNQTAKIEVIPRVFPLPKDTLSAPIRVYFEISLKCNGTCLYCLNSSGRVRPDALSTDEILRIIENLGRDSILETRITGGEPTMHPDFFLIAQAIRQNNMTLSVNSNLLVNTSMLEKLIDLNPDLLITSIDADKVTHTKYRGEGYNQIVQNVRVLRNAKINTRLNCMLSPESLPHIEGFIDEFASMGLGFSFILSRPSGRGQQNFAPPALSKMIPVMDMLKQKRKMYPQTYFHTSFDVVMEDLLVIGGVNLTGCNAIQKSFNVNSDGTILPCAFLYELDPRLFTIGNVRDNDNYSVLPMWRDSQLLRTLRQQSADCNIGCIQCEKFKRECLGSCIYMSLYSQLCNAVNPYCLRSIEATRPSK